MFMSDRIFTSKTKHVENSVSNRSEKRNKIINEIRSFLLRKADSVNWANSFCVLGFFRRKCQIGRKERNFFDESDLFVRQLITLDVKNCFQRTEQSRVLGSD